MSTASTATERVRKDRERVDPPTCDLTTDDMFESLTGFDEIAIKRAWGGRHVTELAQGEPLQFVRALVFIAERRAESKDREAYEAAQALTLGGVADYFADDPEEVDPEDPVTELGKAASPYDGPPTS